MNGLSKNILLITIIPAIAVLLFASTVASVDAARVVCGLQLCADLDQQSRDKDARMMYKDKVDKHMMDKTDMEKMDKHMMDEDKMHTNKMDMDKMDMDKMHMDKMHMDKMHMDKMHMDKMHMDKMDHDRMDNAEASMMDDAHAKKLYLSRANVPATIPLHHGYYDGQDVYFIITDSSDPTHASIITESQGWNVELAPSLKHAPASALSQTYMFTNGLDGKGVHGFQNEVFTSTPATPETYSALTAHTHVTWNDGMTPRLLQSESEIIAARDAGDVTLTDLKVVLNMPHIMWPGGQLTINEAEITDKLPYGGGQVTDIDTDDMTVTFIAHRGWGPDGRSIYYIVTDATPEGPANGMGVVSSPTSANLIANSAAVDLFQFTNGLRGSGPLGFQPGIATAALGDDSYSPMWRISVVTWDNPHYASLLLTIDDLNTMRSDGKITTMLARPGDADHIVNCPFIDPFQ